MGQVNCQHSTVCHLLHNQIDNDDDDDDEDDDEYNGITWGSGNMLPDL